MALRSLTILAFAVGVSACELTEPGTAAPTGLRNVSPAAIAALPPGINESFLIRDDNGCYGLAVEKTEPQTGVALLGADGKQVCDA
ncbi:hypothetical protein [Oceaniglobus ichthyenteri]|uniref:hypothetical protein n=1 Tax=Oceaniglobus ichthyenteri TaxID=2136177 RepID=UPI000D358E27|nr:hypothetical protein [Oceaniglobus ichthyenteri]